MTSTQPVAATAATAAPQVAASAAASQAGGAGATPAAASAASQPSTPTGSGAGHPYQSASLYVGDLSQDVTEALLFEVFNAIGPVASVRVCRDAATRRSLGYAYVNYHRAEDADKAMSLLNFSQIAGRPCRIMWSHRDPSLRRSGQGNIFVKNLAKSIDNRTLYDTFSIFGPILSCKVALSHKGEPLGYGFVHYETEEAAQKAIEKVDGKVIAEQKVSVAAFKSKKERGGESKSSYTNLYVKFLPADFNKDKLEELFAKYGTVTSCMIAMENDNKNSKGFGFVNFAAPEEAAAAVAALNNLEIGGKKLYVGRAQKREERERELRDRFEKLKLERHGKPQLNLYVKNLSDDIDEKKLREEFQKFGSISSCKIMREQNNKSKGFGFISFSTAEEATKAVTEMNGKMLDSKPLYVALAQRKEVRRAELEARRGGPIHQAGGPHMFAGQPMFYGPPQGRFMYPGPMGGNFQGGRGGWMPVPPGAGPHMGQQGRMHGMGPQGPYGYPPQMMPGQGFTGRGGPFMGGPQGQPRQPGQGGRGRGAPAGVGRASPTDSRRTMGMNGAPQPQMMPQGPAGGAAKIEYMQTARNQQRPVPAEGGAGQVAQGGAAGAAAAGAAPAAAAGAKGGAASNLISQLAAASGPQQKQMIGEHLFMRIKQSEPGLAGKITGMLLEMDSSELIALLESTESLAEKIQEAKDVLAQHEAGAATA